MNRIPRNQWSSEGLKRTIKTEKPNQLGLTQEEIDKLMQHINGVKYTPSVPYMTGVASSTACPPTAMIGSINPHITSMSIDCNNGVVKTTIETVE